MIGIYPEWNVKMSFRFGKVVKASIGIYPEWNVKSVSATLCRYSFRIGIYPEWNVKRAISLWQKAGEIIGI